MTKIKIKFWGVRGSLANAGKDFIWVGGNTSCLEINYQKERLIIDAGTGLKLLGDSLKQGTHHILLSHFHTDHICGLPFFGPLYSQSIVNIYAPCQPKQKSPTDTLKQFFSPAFFPVPFEELPAKISVHPIAEEPIKIGSFRIKPFESNHPGATRGFLIECFDKKIAYFGDHEPIQNFNHLKSINTKKYQNKLQTFLKDCDLLIHDAHFFDQEYTKHRGWGHSSWSQAIQLAQNCLIKQLILFHHAPSHKDAIIRKQYAKLQITGLKVSLAREGLILQI